MILNKETILNFIETILNFIEIYGNFLKNMLFFYKRLITNMVGIHYDKNCNL